MTSHAGRVLDRMARNGPYPLKKPAMVNARIPRILASLTAMICLCSATAAPAHALGPDDPRARNERGHFTVKCQVHKNASGNPVLGFVFGNSKISGQLAETESNLYVFKHGTPGAVTKRHCKTQKKFTESGAYDTSMRRL